MAAPVLEEVPSYLSEAEMEPDDEQPKRTRRRRASQDGEAPRTRAPRNSKLNEELLEGYVSLAGDFATAMPTVSGVLIHRAERTVDGMVALAQGHPRVMKALRTSAKFSKGADVLQTLFLVVVAAGVDLGRIPLDSPILDNLGDVAIVRDPNGKAVKDETGRIVKNRVTIRDIYETMTGGASQTVEQNSPSQQTQWAPQPPGPIGVPPMNWTMPPQYNAAG